MVFSNNVSSRELKTQQDFHIRSRIMSIGSKQREVYIRAKIGRRCTQQPVW